MLFFQEEKRLTNIPGRNASGVATLSAPRGWLLAD